MMARVVLCGMCHHRDQIEGEIMRDAEFQADSNLGFSWTDRRAYIEDVYENRHQLSKEARPADLPTILDEVVAALDAGKIRVAACEAGEWRVQTWIKKALELYFKISDCQELRAGYAAFYDKIPLKYAPDHDFQGEEVRIVPTAIVRRGAYLAPHTVLMPSYVNIGAYIDSGTLIDTWATIGSCAQIGKNVHVSGGAGIGGVLEPPQALPTIIEDGCFIGARSEIAEGVIVEAHAVIAMGVFLGQSTPIYDRQTGQTLYGRVPAGAVVIPGSLPSADGTYNKYAAIIVKKVDARTRSKTALNEILRQVWDAGG